MSTTVHTLQKRAYKQVSDDDENVFIYIREGNFASGVRVHLGTSEPDVTTDAYIPLKSLAQQDNVSLGNLTTGNNVWLRAEDKDTKVVVMIC